MSEVYRAGIESVHPSQEAAARSLGLSRVQSMRFVVIPQAIRRVIPPLLNDFIGLQKDSVLVSFIGIVEIVPDGRDQAGGHVQLRRTTSAVALVFIVVTVPMTRLGRLAGRARAPRPGGRRRAMTTATAATTPRRASRCASAACPSRSATLEVLRGIDLDVAEHEVVCLIGASGSGKSTLLRCINLLEPVDDGSIEIEGDEITALGVDVDRIRRRIGIVFQAFNLFPHMRVIDNVTLGAAPCPWRMAGRPRARTRVALLERFGLGDKVHVSTRIACRAGSSSGSRSSGRWRCARTSCCSTRSPAPWTRSWSPRSSTSSAELAVGGMTMVIATHEMGFAREIADRVCFLDAGVILEARPARARPVRDPREARTRQFLQRIIEAGRL